MKDLDKRLEEIFAKQYHLSADIKCRCIGGPVGHFKVDVKQAFTNAGYIQSSNIEQIQKANQLVADMEKVYKESVATLNRLKSTSGYVYTKPNELTKVMTGQEWYNRFDKIWGDMYTEKKNPLTAEEFIQAAQIASGLGEKQ
ncbi:MAG TPA: hypothetical protein VJ836_00680 [Candidatus Saccharimonadales bacterium]|nr:hypothetical protein [Candidatus Saccharimonadales bacterium]